MLPALIIGCIFAYLIHRLAAAHFKHKLGEQSSDDWTDADTRTAAPADLKIRAAHFGGDSA